MLSYNRYLPARSAGLAVETVEVTVEAEVVTEVAEEDLCSLDF